jgi:uncharacterized membrane protein YphA (DoxX/SURF4 family)
LDKTGIETTWLDAMINVHCFKMNIAQQNILNKQIMTKQNLPSAKANKIIYWIATVWLALGMVSTGFAQLMKMKSGAGGVDTITRLEYPIYFLTLIGVWKILGVVALLIPKFPVLKEWAYAGFFFVMTGAVFSHIALGDGPSEIFPSILLLILILVSWYFRPPDKKIAGIRATNIPVNQ